jgi:two-component system alkaline phosphatase synthesis response regulator PhoP
MNTVLYIGDDAHDARMIDTCLSSCGFDVETAFDGHEGVRKARDLQPDVILLDLYLPRVEGLEVITRIREDALTWNIPVVVMSSLPTSQSRQLMEGTGVQDYVSKPFKTRDLIATVRRNAAQRPGAASDLIVH